MSDTPRSTLPGDELGPISPELVLVSPELAEAARARLPDPPEPRAREQAAPAPAPPPAAAPAPAPEVTGRPFRPLGVAFAALLILMIGFSLGDGNTQGPVLLDEPFAVRGVETTAPAGTETIAPTTPPGAAETAPTTTETPDAPAAPQGIRPPADGGFSFGNGSFFRVGRDARSIVEFQAQQACAPQVRVPPLPIKADGSFRYDGRLPLPGNARVHVAIRGRFETTETARGALRYRTSTCDTGLVRWVAQLS